MDVIFKKAAFGGGQQDADQVEIEMHMEDEEGPPGLEALFNDEEDYKDAVTRWYSREAFDEHQEAQVTFIEEKEQQKFFQSVEKLKQVIQALEIATENFRSATTDRHHYTGNQKQQEEHDLKYLEEKTRCEKLSAEGGTVMQRITKFEERLRPRDLGTIGAQGGAKLDTKYRMVLSTVVGIRNRWQEAYMHLTRTEKEISLANREDLKRRREIQQSIFVEGGTGTRDGMSAAEELDVLEDLAMVKLVKETSMSSAADKQFAMHYNMEAHHKEAQMQEILSKQYEIQELWNQLNLLVVAQGEVLDNILVNLETSKGYVEEANVDLKIAETYTAGTTSCYRYLLCGLFVVFTILAVVAYFQFGAN